jgi:uncharacterized membrane protein YqjE
MSTSSLLRTPRRTDDEATTALSGALRSRFGRPTVGAGAAAKALAEDTSALIRAEIELARTELARGVKEKAAGTGMLAAAGLVAFLAMQALLVTAGVALALVLPAWAAAAVVTVALLLVAATLAAAGKRKLATPARLDVTKETIEEDIAWAKTQLRR